MRLVILTHYFAPEAGAPQVRLAELARGLAGAGADVTVHTCPPHYPDGVVRPGYRNGVRPRVEERDGVRVVRSIVLPAANRGVTRRLADHASFAASALATGRAAGRADVVLAETPPLFLAAVAPRYARARRARLVLHVSDLWPDSVVELGAVTSPRAIAAARRLERHAYRGADAVVAPTAGIVRRLAERPEAAGKVRQIPPAVDVARFRAAPPVREGPLRVLYAGTVGMAQGVGTLVEAARRAGPEAVALTIAGAGAELEAVRAAATGAPNVRVLEAVAADRVPGLYASSDVGAVVLRDRPLFEGALPTKLFEAMAAGRPVVVAARGESAELVADTGAGVVVAPEDVDALAAALLRLGAAGDAALREMGARGLAGAAGFTREAMVRRWRRLLDELAA
ncbi:MAG: glycosyltransferase family 4 protein [Thermoleophilaceae bacterium]